VNNPNSNAPKLLALACVAALTLAACNKPAEAPAPEAAAPVAPAPVAEVTPTGVSSAEAPTFDQKAFAGVFKGTLPCADCAGTDATLELKPDGTYVISETFKGKAGGAKMDGTWTAEAGDKNLRLDPNSKAEADRVFAISGNDQLAPLGADGQPVAANAAFGLKREGSAK